MPQLQRQFSPEHSCSVPIIEFANESDLLAIRRLIYGAYLKLGYCSQNPSGELRINPLHEVGVCPHTTVLKATISRNVNGQQVNEIVGTLSVTLDSKSHSVPIEEDFTADLKRWRSSGEFLAYYWRFAVSSGMRASSSLKIAAQLYAHAAEMGIGQGVDRVVCIANPRHMQFYLDWGFGISGEAPCASGLEKAPAVLLSADAKVVNALFLSRYIKHGGMRPPPKLRVVHNHLPEQEN